MHPAKVFFISLIVGILVLPAGSCRTASKATAEATNQLRMVDSTELLNDIRYLSSDELKGRLVGTPGNITARDFLVDQLRIAGVEPLVENYLQPFTITRRNDTNKIACNNVLGLIRGRIYSDKYIVLSAHFDHVGERNGQIYNGADDNASGTAALIQFAKYFSKNRPENNIIIAFFDAEESGLRGASHFVANPPIAKENILLNVNMDMVGRNDNNELYACGTFHYPYLKQYIDPVKAIAPIKIMYGHDDPSKGTRDDWTFQSDQGAFHREKIPFIYFGVEDHSDYHQPTDEFERIQPSFYYNAVRSILTVVTTIDKNTKKAKN